MNTENRSAWLADIIYKSALAEGVVGTGKLAVINHHGNAITVNNPDAQIWDIQKYHRSIADVLVAAEHALESAIANTAGIEGIENDLDEIMAAAEVRWQEKYATYEPSIRKGETP